MAEDFDVEAMLEAPYRKDAVSLYLPKIPIYYEITNLYTTYTYNMYICIYI